MKSGMQLEDIDTLKIFSLVLSVCSGRVRFVQFLGEGTFNQQLFSAIKC